MSLLIPHLASFRPQQMTRSVRVESQSSKLARQSSCDSAGRHRSTSFKSRQRPGQPSDIDLLRHLCSQSLCVFRSRSMLHSSTLKHIRGQSAGQITECAEILVFQLVSRRDTRLSRDDAWARFLNALSTRKKERSAFGDSTIPALPISIVLNRGGSPQATVPIFVPTHLQNRS